jgi:hypothetical protein
MRAGDSLEGLRAGLEAMLASVERSDVAAAVEQAERLRALCDGPTEGSWDQAAIDHVRALLDHCLARSLEVRAQLENELKQAGTSRRARSAYAGR